VQFVQYLKIQLVLYVTDSTVRVVTRTSQWPCCVVCGANGATDRETVSERDSETEKKWDRRGVRQGESETVIQRQRQWEGETERQWEGETERQWEGETETVRGWDRDSERVRERQWEGETVRGWDRDSERVRQRQWEGETVRGWDRDSERVRQRDRQWEGVTCTDTSFEAPLHQLGVKDEAKVVSVHAMKACMGSRGVAPLMVKLCAKWRWIFGFTPLPLYSPGSLNNRHGLHQGCSGSFGEDRKLCSCQESKSEQPRPWLSRTDWSIPAPALSGRRKENVNSLKSSDYLIYRQV